MSGEEKQLREALEEVLEDIHVLRDVQPCPTDRAIGYDIVIEKLAALLATPAATPASAEIKFADGTPVPKLTATQVETVAATPDNQATPLGEKEQKC